MKRGATDKVFMLLIRLAAIVAMFTFVQAASAQEIPLAESAPAVIYYTTNGAEPIVAPLSAPTTYINYYIAEGTKITLPNTAASTDTPLGVSETISLVPGAGKGKPYVKPANLKIHESKKEFEKHLKQRHGKRFTVEIYGVKPTENGLDGHIYIVENKDPSLQLSSLCTEEERARRIAIAREFILNNPELIGFTENEELHERGRERTYCGNLYFDTYVNEYELKGAGLHFSFVPVFNYSVSIDNYPITPEMYAAAQQPGLSTEEIAKIVYKDLNIPLDGNNGNKPPQLLMHKYLRNREPYAIWEVRGRYIYEINAVTGEIAFKQLNVKY